MDPDETLLALRHAFLDLGHAERVDNRDKQQDALEAIANAAQALDEWITKGGFLPKDWQTEATR